MFNSDSEARKGFPGCIGKVEMSVLSFGAFFRAVRFGSFKYQSFSLLSEVCDDQWALMCESRR